MAKKNSSIKLNYLYNVSYQIFALLVPLIVTPYISRVLGAGNIGNYSFTYSIVSYFMLLAALGTGTYGIKQIGTSNTKDERSVNFYNILIFRICTTLICIIGYFSYFFIFNRGNTIVLLQSLYLFGVLFDISWFFQGIEDFKKVSIRNFIFKILTVICIFAFVKDYNDLGIYILCLAGLTVLGNISIWLYLPKKICKISISKIKPFRDIKSIILIFFPTIAVQIYSLIDKTLIGILINGNTTEIVTEIIDGASVQTEKINTIANLENGFYEQSEKIVKMCLMVVTSLGTVMIPRISKAFRNKDFNSIKIYIEKSFRFVGLTAIPMLFGLLAVSSTLVPVFFGSGYDKVIDLLKIFSFLFLFMGINSVVGNQYLISTGQQSKYTIVLMIGGIINVILDLILIPYYYSYGAAIASVIGEVIITIIGITIVCRSGICNIKTIFVPFIKYIIAGLVMFTSVKIIDLYTEPSIKTLMLEIGIGCFSYLLCLIIERDIFVYDIIKKLAKILNNKFYFDISINNRIEWIDCVKGIGVLLVVIGHFVYKTNLNDSLLIKIIYSFHIPLFFIIAGLTKKDRVVDLKKEILKNIKKYTILYFIFVGSYFICNLIYFLITKENTFFDKFSNSDSLINTIICSKESIFSIFWFIPCLLISNIIYIVLRYYFENELHIFSSILLLSIISILFCKLINYSLPFCLENALFSLIFIEIGYLIKNKFIIYLSKIKFCVICLVLYICLFALMIQFNDLRFDFSHMNFSSIICFIILSITASLFIISLCIIVFNKGYRSSFIRYLGEYSIYIYGFHFLLLPVFQYLIVNTKSDVTYFYIIIIFSIFECFIITLCCYIYKIIKKLFLNKKMVI